MEDLSEFVTESNARAEGDQGAQASIVKDLLIFEYGSERFAVAATVVDAVIGWRSPAAIPGSDARVRGVFQDRGRIVVLLTHPTGQARETQSDNRRIVICKTARGHVGLPASVTNAVTAIELKSEPTRSSLHDSQFGPFTFLEPDRWADEV